MTPELLKLHIAQVSKIISRSKTNRYSDTRKENYHKNLEALLEKIKSEDLENLSYYKQVEIKKIIDFIFRSFEFLDNSILTVIPHEIVFCLEKALNDWDSSNNYIIVTTLNNETLGYYFDPTLSLDPTSFDLIKANYSIEFPHRLIQISLPKYLANDYLANVVLYHELGHFIDLKYKISESIVRKSFHEQTILETNLNREYNHYSEYFADIFAAQYIGDSSSNYLSYIAHKHKDGKSHPSTDKRIQIVSDFLKGAPSEPYLKNLSDATIGITGKKLSQRYSIIPDQDFKEFIPPIFENTSELHSVFKVGWDLWMTEVKSFQVKGISYEEKYTILNNLIEKSINNFMVLESWPK